MLNLIPKDETVLKVAQTKPGTTTSIIIPAYNEEEGLPVVLEKIFRSTNGVHEVLVIDDGSSDATAEIACKFPCHVIKHNTNCGKGKALETGIRYAEGENLIFIDSDDTYPPEAIPAMTDALKSHDMVYGSRTYGRENIPLFNRLGNWILQTMIRTIYSFKASDFSTGLYGMKKHHFYEMDVVNMGICIESEIAIKASRMNLYIKDIPIEYSPRLGESKLPRIAAGYGNLKNVLGYVFWRPGVRKV